MEPVIHLVVLLFGFIFGFIIYELTRYRIGGVIAIPIMVVYTMDNPLTLPIFVFSIIVCLLAVYIINENTLLYGRRLLYLNLAISIITTSLIFFYTDALLNMNFTALTVGSIFPGIIAYNISRESFDLEKSVITIVMTLANFLIVLLFAIALTLIVGWTP